MDIPAPLALERLAHDARGVQSVVGGALEELSRAKSVDEIEPLVRLARRGLARLKMGSERSAAVAEMLKRAPVAHDVALKPLAERAVAMTDTLVRRGATVEREIDSERSVKGDELFLAAAFVEALALTIKSTSKRGHISLLDGRLTAVSDGRVVANDAEVVLAQAIIEHAVKAAGGAVTWATDPVSITISFPEGR